MSAKDDGEGFLSRWSRLKRSEEQSQPTNKVGATGQEPAAADAQIPAADEPSLADLTKLPRLDELTSGSDFAAFLQKGVPEELKRLALRKAWSLDPAIRDFVEVAENQYDWNAPGGVPGFGEIAPGTDMKALLAQAIGEVAKPETESGRSERAEALEPGTAVIPAKSDDPLRGPSDFAGAETPAPSSARAGSLRPTAVIPASATVEPVLAEPTKRPAHRPRHGGALPQVPKSP